MGPNFMLKGLMAAAGGLAGTQVEQALTLGTLARGEFEPCGAGDLTRLDLPI